MLGTFCYLFLRLVSSQLALKEIKAEVSNLLLYNITIVELISYLEQNEPKENQSLSLTFLQKDTVWNHSVIFKTKSVVDFSCEDVNDPCSIWLTQEMALLFNGGLANFNGITLRFDNSPAANKYIAFMNGAIIDFKSCTFAGNFFGNSTSIIEATGGKANFQFCVFTINVKAKESTLIKSSNHTHIRVDSSRFLNIRISEDSSILEITEGKLEMNNVSIFGLEQLNKNQCQSTIIDCRNSLFLFVDSEFTIFEFYITNLSLQNYYLISINRCIACTPNFLKSITLSEVLILNGGLASIRNTEGTTEIFDLKIENSIIYYSAVFYSEASPKANLIFRNCSVVETKLSLYLYAREISSVLLINVHLSKFNDAKTGAYLLFTIAETFLFMDSFNFAELRNLTINDLPKIQPTIILKNSAKLGGAIAIVKKCSFINTRIEESSYSAMLGINYGGVLSLKDIYQIFINDTLFKGNKIDDPLSTMGSAGIYCESSDSSTLLIYQSLFLQNQVSIGPFLISFFGYSFLISDSYILNTTSTNLGASGLALARIKASLIKLENIKCFSSSITDGLFFLIERNSFNRVLITNFVACNNTALKRGAGSFILDGSSRNREVLLKDSLFVNNVAYTQNAAGLHIFHSSYFEHLNLTYFNCKFFHNVASLGTSWWVRVAHKNANLLVLDCEIHSSMTFLRSVDLSVAYSVGTEQGFQLTVRNCLLNSSLSRTYGFYIKDIKALFENVSLIDQRVFIQDATLFRVEAAQLSLHNCSILNQTSNSRYFNVQENSSLTVNRSSFNSINCVNSSLFSISKSRMLIYNTQFSNISSVSLIYIVSTKVDLNVPNVLENLSFFNCRTLILKAMYAFVIIKHNSFMSMASTIFSLDGTKFEFYEGFITGLDCFAYPLVLHFLKAAESEVVLDRIIMSESATHFNSELIFLKDVEINITNSSFTNIESYQGKGLIKAKDSNVSIISSEFLSVWLYILKATKCSCVIINNIFSGSETKNSRIDFFFEINENNFANFSKNQFKSALLKRAAINAAEMNERKEVFYVEANIFEGMQSPLSSGSCVNTININIQLRGNIFRNNKAYLAGAVNIYCDLSLSENKNKSECDWLFVENIFLSNSAETLAGALRWLYVPPKNQSANTFFKNLAADGLQYESFPVRIIATNLVGTYQYTNRNFALITNHTSSTNLEEIRFEVVDTYGQAFTNFHKITVDLLHDNEVEKLSEFSSINYATFSNLLLENKKMISRFNNNESIYKYKAPVLFGKTILLRDGQNGIVDGESFSLNNTFLTGTPGFYIFLNISSPDLFSQRKNFSGSFLYEVLKAEEAISSMNEIRTPTSYSFIVPVNIKICGFGQYFDAEKNLCESCEPNSFNYLLNQTQCEPCPDGAVCKGGNDFFLKGGYWRKRNDSKNVYECNIMILNCLGGLNSNCSEDYKGNLCFTCKGKEGGLPMQKSYSAHCKECPTLAGQVIITLFMFILFFESLRQFSHLFFGNERCRRKQLALKCLINYFHTFILISTYNLNTESILETYITVIHKISLAIEFWFSLECYFGFFFDDKSPLIRHLSEIIFFHLFIMIFMLLRVHPLGILGSVPKKADFLEDLLFIWYILYPTVLHHIIRASMCKKIEDGYFFIKEPDVSCLESESIALIGCNLLLFFLWNIYGPYKLIKELKLFEQNSCGYNNANRNILVLDYEKDFLQIEIKFYFFKCALVAINAVVLREDYKMLMVWPVFFYYLLIESQKWKLFKSDVQIKTQVMIIINFIVLPYSFLWMSLTNASLVGVFLFMVSICFQISISLFIVSSYFNLSIIKKMRNIIQGPLRNKRNNLDRPVKASSEKGHPRSLTHSFTNKPVFIHDQIESRDNSSVPPNKNFASNEGALGYRGIINLQEVSLEVPGISDSIISPLDRIKSPESNGVAHTPKCLSSNFSEKKRQYFM